MGQTYQMKIIIAILIILITAFAIGCVKESGDVPGNPGPPNPNNTCDGVNAKFAADISPIIQTKCATSNGCHGNGSFNGPGPLTTFTQIQNAANSIKTAVNNGRMPLGGSLTTSELQKINCWVNSGAPNN